MTQRKVAQVVKWSVYSLLLVNFGVYLIDDWQAYSAALAVDAGMDKVLETFADSFDMAAWIALVVLLELETYILSDKALEAGTGKLIKLLRIISCALIVYAGIWAGTGYTIYAWDAFLWIVGFWAIELNLAEWEKARVLELATTE